MNTSLIGSKTNAIFFLDIDGTLINPSQDTNSNTLPKLIQSLSKHGILFGLNSNRSIQDLRPIYDAFKLNGPMVIENGVFYRIPESKKDFFLTREKPTLIKKTTVAAIKEFIASNSLNSKFKIGDSSKLIKSLDVKKYDSYIIANGFRKYSGNIHIYKNGERDPETAGKLKKFLKAYFERTKAGLQVDGSRVYSNVSFHPREIDKGKALRELRKTYPHHSFYMIGDDIADLKTLKYIDGFFAVGNAEPEVKKKSEFVASNDYTSGVEEILKWYAKRSGIKN